MSFFPNKMHTALSAALCAAALAFSGAAGAGPIKGGTLTYLQDIEPYDWDLSHDWPVSLLQLGASFADRLIYLDRNGVYQPWLAKSWEISEDGTAFTFTLRDDVTFHDGDRFDARAVGANIDKWLADKASWNPSGAGIDGYHIVDDFTIRIRLKKASAAAQWLMSTGSWAFLSPKTIANHAAEVAGNVALQASTGPFKVESYVAGQSLTLVRNEDYKWPPQGAENPGAAYLDRVVVNFVKDPGVRLGSLISGQAELVANIPPLFLSQIEANPALQIYHAQATGVPYQLAVNIEAEPTNDLLVRRAFRAALDIKASLDAVYAGRYPQAWSPLAPNTPPENSYNEALENSWTSSIEEANALLDQAGWTGRDAEGFRTKDGKRLELRWAVRTAVIEDQRDTLGEAFQAAVRKAGIALVRDLYDNAAYTAALKEGRYNITDRPWSTPDVYVLTNAYWSGTSSETGGANYARIKDAEVDRLARSLTDERDNSVRVANARELQRLAVENVWSIPVYPRQVNFGAASGLEGVTFDVTGWLDSLQGAWIAE